MRREVPVSIILPTYNRAALLPRAIESVLGQSYGDFELIVVDDGSEDDSAGVVASFTDERIRYLRLAKNGGLSKARNAGLAQVRGAYVAFQDSDDEWMADKLERQRCLLETHPEAAAVYADMLRVCADGRVLYLRSPTIVPGRLINPQTRYWQSYMLALQPALIRHACFRELRFDERLPMFEDLDFYLRLAQHHALLHMPEPLVKYYETHGMTSDRQAELTGRRLLLRKYAGELLAGYPAFLFKETVDVLLRRSLLPIVNRHLTPI
jgi:glycosyltransferase involved in cell wall biosynthesis